MKKFFELFFLIAFTSSPAGARENIQLVGFDADQGAACLFDKTTFNTSEDGTVNYEFYFDPRGGLVDLKDGNTVSDGFARKIQLHGKLEESSNPEHLLLKITDNSDHIFHYDWLLTVDKQTKEIREFQKHSTYVGQKNKYAPVREIHCRNIISSKKLADKNHLTAPEALSILFPDPLKDMPNCLAISKFILYSKRQESEKIQNLGTLTTLGSILLANPLGVLVAWTTVAANSLLEQETLEKSMNTAQALQQANTLIKTPSAAFASPIINKWGGYKDGGRYYDMERRDKVTRILNTADQSKELCSTLDPQTNKLVYAPKSFDEIKLFIDEKLAAE